MVFSSITFLFFYLWIVVLIYKISPIKFRNLWLFLASLFFYGFGEPIYVLLMLFSIIVNYYFGYKVSLKNGKKYLILSIVFNLLLLSIFKYTNFFVSILNLFELNIYVPEIKLPIGISFYTFQMMSYPIDIYRKEVKPQKSLINFSAYVTMFPQLIAGPIVRYKDIAEQLDDDYRASDMFLGLKRFMVGLSKKVLLANNIGYIFETIIKHNINNISMLTAWLGIIAFSLQIYFDFSGYSDMAIGLGKMFGFDFIENFDYPYCSKSVTEFWRRWHISLSSWFKDYVYIPLGGSRVSKLRSIINILIVWSLTGLWHGASYNFVLWGLYYGVILILEKKIIFKYFKTNHIYTLFIVMIGWVLFSINDYNMLILYLKKMFDFSNIIDIYFILYIKNYFIILFIGILCSTPLVKNIYNKYFVKYELVNSLLIFISFILCISSIISSSYNPFLYFRF